MLETRKRSVVRSIIWRLIGIAFLAAVTYAFTRQLIVTTEITLLHHGIFIFVYYFHERAWLKWGKGVLGKKKRIARIFTYEIILGQGILAMISYAFTGSLQQMTLITITYIWNKLWMYAIYDYVWDKIKWDTDIRRKIWARKK